MRKVILVSNVPPAGPALGVGFTDLLRAEADTVIAGREDYHQLNEVFSALLDQPDGPPELVDFATWMVETPTIVFSRVLTGLLSPKDRLVTGDIPTELKTVKEAAGKGLVLFGDGEIVQEFVRHGLVDEYWQADQVALGNRMPLIINPGTRRPA